MTEFEARRELLSDPRRISAELAEAIAADPRLAALREELLAADAAMQRMLTAPPLPEGLAERLVLRARFPSRSRLGLALAASLVALALAVPSWFRLRVYDAELARDRAMIEHVAQSRRELEDDAGVEPAVLRASLRQVGIRMRAPQSRVRHLANCVIAGIESRHFVLEGPHGPISYIVLPGADGASAAERTLERDGLRGLFVQRSGATIGVFAQASASREELERMMRDVLA